MVHAKQDKYNGRTDHSKHPRTADHPIRAP